MKKAQVLSVINRHGETFKIGDKVKFFSKTYIIKAFRTDSPMPNWLSTKQKKDHTYWIMAHVENYWVNIDMVEKPKK